MVVKVENLVKRYKDLLALDDFNLELKEGEILGLLGPNGCGKTTAINCILSLLKYDKGYIEIFGKKMRPDAYDIKSKIGVVPQELALFENLSVRENIDYFCGLYIRDKRTRDTYVNEAIDFVGLGDYRKFLPKKLSGGLKRRLNIACGIAHKPSLIFLDEPTVAVDAQSRNFILEGIKGLNKKGATILYTSHYLEEVEILCNRIVIMDRGKNLISGTNEELKSSISTSEIIRLELTEDFYKLEDMIMDLPHIIEVERTEEDYIIKFENGANNISNLLDFLKENI